MIVGRSKFSRKGCKVLKVCSKCKRELPLDCFAVDKRGKDGLCHQCKDCRKEYFKNHYKCAKQTVESYKTHCAKCHCAEPYVLTFHHIDHKTKSFDLSVARRKHEDVMKEVEKCICLCYNCHHTYHYFYGMQPTNPVESLTEFLDPSWEAPTK